MLRVRSRKILTALFSCILQWLTNEEVHSKRPLSKFKAIILNLNALELGSHFISLILFWHQIQLIKM